MRSIRSLLAGAFLLVLGAGMAHAASTCNVKEYKDVGHSLNGEALQIGQEPPVADQSPVDFTSGEAKSAAFNSATRYVEIICNAQASYLVGSSPTATANNSWVPSGVSKFFGVTAGHKISFITKP